MAKKLLPNSTPDTYAKDFERVADERSRGCIVEFWQFARHNKKWWMTPIIAILLLLSSLVLLGSTGAGPFIYTLF
jgi:hypothetical protein